MKRNINLLLLASLSFLIPQYLTLPLSAQETDPLEQLLKTKECPGCDLSGVNLSGVDLSGANLSGADLSNASLSNTMLAGANLSGANLRGANLRLAVLIGADISGADFSYTNLTDTNFYRAKANQSGGVDFTGATLSRTIMPNGTVRNPGAQEVPKNQTPQEPTEIPQ